MSPPAGRAFRDLHRGPEALLLPNAWDVASALAFADAGFPAVGTTSLGIAAAAGLPDAERAVREPTVALARRLAGFPVPVSADLADGFADQAEQVAELVASIEVAGVNLEDSTGGRLVDPGRHADKIVAVGHSCPDVFVNARVDTYWLGQDASLRPTLERALRYVEAGADGVFVPGVLRLDDIATLAVELPVPLNVLAAPDLTMARLAELGVRRVSTGSLPFRAALDAGVAVAVALREGQRLPQASSYARIEARTRAWTTSEPERAP